MTQRRCFAAMIGVVLVFREVTERRSMERERRDRAEALAAAGRRRDPRTTSARLIAISGYSDAADRHRTQAVGFDAHLAKPVAFAVLQPLLQAAPKRKR